MNSRVVLAAIASLTLTIVISGCSSGAAEKSSPAANPIKPAVSNSNKSGNDPVGFSDREVGPIGLNLIWSYHHPNKIQQAFEANGNLYLVSATKSHDHVLMKVDGETGLPRWTYPLQVPLQFAPVVYVYPEELKNSKKVVDKNTQVKKDLDDYKFKQIDPKEKDAFLDLAKAVSAFKIEKRNVNDLEEYLKNKSMDDDQYLQKLEDLKKYFIAYNKFLKTLAWDQKIVWFDKNGKKKVGRFVEFEQSSKNKVRERLAGNIQNILDGFYPKTRDIASFSSNLEKPILGGVTLRGDNDSLLTQFHLTHNCKGEKGMAIKKIVLNKVDSNNKK